METVVSVPSLLPPSAISPWRLGMARMTGPPSDGVPPRPRGACVMGPRRRASAGEEARGRPPGGALISARRTASGIIKVDCKGLPPHSRFTTRVYAAWNAAWKRFVCSNRFIVNASPPRRGVKKATHCHRRVKCQKPPRGFLSVKRDVV